MNWRFYIVIFIHFFFFLTPKNIQMNWNFCTVLEWTKCKRDKKFFILFQLFPSQTQNFTIRNLLSIWPTKGFAQFSVLFGENLKRNFELYMSKQWPTPPAARYLLTFHPHLYIYLIIVFAYYKHSELRTARQHSTVDRITTWLAHKV